MIPEGSPNTALHQLLVIGLVMLVSLYIGKWVKRTKLPSLIGYMLVGVVAGPFVLNGIDKSLLSQLDFIVEVGLGLVAFTIGAVLSVASFKKTGRGLASLILGETIVAFLVVTLGVYLFFDNWPLAMLLGAIGAASAPAGTVAIIQDYQAKGRLTNTLYAVVGFDDGLSVIIYGFALVFAKSILLQTNGHTEYSVTDQLWAPFQEILLSILVGLIAGYVFLALVKKLRKEGDILVLSSALVMILVGLSQQWHLSLVLTNMVAGMVLVNSGREGVINRVRQATSMIMPLVFILFFALAGAHLDISSLLIVGGGGVVYIISRCIGKAGGAWIGGTLGGADPQIARSLGLAILSQAGLAIGLALIVQKEMAHIAVLYNLPSAAEIGATVLTTITATTVIFEIIGPILTRHVLSKAGEINDR
ncbi:cation:proton antiporter [Alkalimarinus coralli]|uniref:cation:proton antiporter n=1 Tax=Alkalimarinus coralli TaxID=2935863 RepID=UPI00202AE3CD|nr:cation:proton antiporter [Alkalimarinus coralli]